MIYYNGPYQFGIRSTKELKTIHPNLQIVLLETISFIDFSIIQGHRNKKLQNIYYNKGRSQLKWPEGQHNKMPSHAVDIAPYPIDWSNNPKVLARFYMLMGMIYAVSVKKKIKLRYGCDWNSNFDFTDQTFDDLCHIELAHP